eukprot:6177056-Pleurochrysis_carterae.AAC.2
MEQTADEGIELRAGGRPKLVAYSDSDWAVAYATTGFCNTYGLAAILYGSERQHCISPFSIDAEIVAALHTAAEVIYLRGLLAEMGQKQQHPATMMSKERRLCQRSRHVDRRDLIVREYVAHGCIEVRKIHTDDNVVDVFT